MYILNLTLGCWVTDDDSGDAPGKFLMGDEDTYLSLEELITHWNNTSLSNKWDDIHCPCRIEHFELYDELPEDWDRYVHT